MILLLLYLEAHIFMIETLEKLGICYPIMIVLLLFIHLLVVEYISVIPCCITFPKKKVSNDSRLLHVVEPPRGSISSGQIESQLIHPGPSSSRSRVFYGVESVVRRNADSLLNPLLQLLAIAGDVHPNPGPSRVPLLRLLQKRH